MLRRIDPLYYALALVALFGAIKLMRPDIGYRKAVGAWLYQPQASAEPCVVPPGREFTIEYFGMLYRGETSSFVDKRVLCYGAWEKEVLNVLDGAVEALDRQDLVFVDVGAHTGLHSLFMAKRAAEVHAFDPYPPVLKRLADNVGRNGLDNIRIHPVGLGAETARFPFFAPPESNDSTGSFRFGAELNNQEEQMELEVVVGDEYFAQKGITRIDIIKIDVEGFEKPVLQGLRNTLRSTRPVALVEITVTQGGEGLFETEADLRAALPPDYEFFGYRTWNVSNGQFELGPLDIDFETTGRQWDIVAVPSEVSALIPLSRPHLP